MCKHIVLLYPSNIRWWRSKWSIWQTFVFKKAVDSSTRTIFCTCGLPFTGTQYLSSCSCCHGTWGDPNGYPSRQTEGWAHIMTLHNGKPLEFWRQLGSGWGLEKLPQLWKLVVDCTIIHTLKVFLFPNVLPKIGAYKTTHFLSGLFRVSF